MQKTSVKRLRFNISGAVAGLVKNPQPIEYKRIFQRTKNNIPVFTPVLDKNVLFRYTEVLIFIAKCIIHHFQGFIFTHAIAHSTIKKRINKRFNGFIFTGIIA